MLTKRISILLVLVIGLALGSLGSIACGGGSGAGNLSVDSGDLSGGDSGSDSNGALASENNMGDALSVVVNAMNVQSESLPE